MRQITGVNASLAISGGVLAAGGAIALLVKDAFVTGWTVEHALMPVLVSLTVLSGHLFWSALKAFKLISACGLAVLTMMGSGITIYETMGRRAASRDMTVAVATQSVETLARVAGDHAKTKALVAEAQAWVASECKSGAGPKCQGVTFILNQRSASLASLDKMLSDSRPAPAADPKAERVAALAGVFGVSDRMAVKLAVSTFEPFAFPLFLELAAIVLFGLGTGCQRPMAPATNHVAPAASLAITEENRDITDAEIDELRRLLQMSKGPLTNKEVAERLRVSKGEASKRVTRLVEVGEVRREKAGREVAISLH